MMHRLKICLQIFKNLEINLESNQTDNDKLELELNSTEKGKIENVPKWILNAKSKNSERLDYFKNNKKKKVYVNLPSERICSFCGKTGHMKTNVPKGNSILSPTEIMSILFGLRKLIHVKSTKNPRETRFLILTINCSYRSK